MKSILTDILLESELNSSEIFLHDIDLKRLKTSQIVADNISRSLRSTASIKATPDRREALKNADFVIVMIQVGGYKPSTVIDFEIPAKYGLQQTIADTLGIGGIMRGLRTVPVLVEIAQDMIELCPRALMLQYVNPMAINCLSLSHFVPELRYVGLCHSVQGTVADLARDIGEDLSKIEYECSGINHMSFFTKFEKYINTEKGKKELKEMNSSNQVMKEKSGMSEQEILSKRFKKFDAYMGDKISPDCIDLLHKIFELSPVRRISAEDILKHPFFTTTQYQPTGNKISVTTK